MNGQGLTRVVLGQSLMEDALVPVSIDGPPVTSDSTAHRLSLGTLVPLLPVGPIPPNPAEFVGSQALAALLSELDDQADLILVDAPPILDLSDPMTLSARVDGLVVVAHLQTLKRSTVQELHRVLSAAPATKLGFVVTGTPVGATYGSGYGYGYGYGHGSGYDATVPISGPAMSDSKS